MAPPFGAGTSSASSSPATSPQLSPTTSRVTPASSSSYHQHRFSRFFHKLLRTKTCTASAPGTPVAEPPPARYKPRRSPTFTHPLTGIIIRENELGQQLETIGGGTQDYLASNPPIPLEKSKTYERMLEWESKKSLDADGIFTLKDPSEVVEEVVEEIVEEIDGEEMRIAVKKGSERLCDEEYVLVGRESGSSFRPGDSRKSSIKTPFSPPQMLPKTLGAFPFPVDSDEDAPPMLRSLSSPDLSSVASSSSRASPYAALPRVSSLRDLTLPSPRTPPSPIARPFLYRSADTLDSIKGMANIGSDEYKELFSQIKRIQKTDRVRFDDSSTYTCSGGLNGSNVQRVVKRRGF